MSRKKVVKQAAFIAPGNKEEDVKYIISIIDIKLIELNSLKQLYYVNRIW